MAKKSGSASYTNDLDVEDIVIEIKKDLQKHIKERVVISLRHKMQEELEEQYHPKRNSKEFLRDNRIKNIRKLAIWGFYCISAILVVIGSLVAAETIPIGFKTFTLIRDGFDNLMLGNFTTAIDRTLLNKIIFSILSVLDLLLLTSLVIMVLIGGYENTVGRIGISHEVPAWFGSLGITDLKVKVAASIVIISSIHLLTQFMLIEPTMPESVAPNFEKIVACNSNVQKDAAMFETSGIYTDKSRQEIARIERAFDTCEKAKIEQEKLSILSEAGISDGDSYFDLAYSKSALMWTSLVHVVFVLAALALALMGRISDHQKYQSYKDSREAVLNLSDTDTKTASNTYTIKVE